MLFCSCSPKQLSLPEPGSSGSSISPGNNSPDTGSGGDSTGGTNSQSSSAQILLYSLNGIAGVITDHNITVTMPFGTDVTSLIASFSTTGKFVAIGTVPQMSTRTKNNFSKPLIYTVTANDGSTQNYTVTVIVSNPVPPPPETIQVLTSVSVNGNPVNNIEISQGRVVTFVLSFQTDSGIILNLKAISTDSNLTIPKSSCDQVDNTKNCKLNLIYTAKTPTNYTILPVYFTYTGNLNKNLINNFTYKVKPYANKKINIQHGKINTLTWKDSSNLLVNSDRKNLEAVLPVTYLTTMKLSSNEILDYPAVDERENNVSYSNPFVDANGNVVQKRVAGSSANLFYPGIYVNDTPPGSYLLKDEPNPDLEAPFLNGFKIAPVPTQDNLAYYVTTIDRFIKSEPALYPYLMKINPVLGNMNNPGNWFQKLDPLTGDNSQIEPPRPPVVKNSQIYFKSNYILQPPNATDPASPEVFIFSLEGQIINRWSLNSSKSNLVVSDDGQFLFIGDDKGVIHVYDATNGVEFTFIKFAPTGSFIRHLIISSVSNTLFALSDTGVFLYDISNMTGSINYKKFSFLAKSNISSYNMMLNSAQNLLYVASGSVIYALNTFDLAKVWDSSFSAIIAGTITALTLDNPNRAVYVGTDSGMVYSFTLND